MTASPESQAQEQKPSDKELNFRALEQKYQRQLEQERSARMQAEQTLQDARSTKSQDDDEEDSEPYVDKRKLNKTLSKFSEQSKQQTQSDIQVAVKTAIYEERKTNWIKSNPDFYEVLQHAEKFAQKDPELAEAILEMPEGFERQKLVYKNIKALGMHKPEVKQSTIQEKVDSNRRSPFYQPSQVGTAPYSSQSDYSKGGQKQAYDKMQELKNRLRLG
jgi:hypothetical protein